MGKNFTSGNELRVRESNEYLRVLFTTVLNPYELVRFHANNQSAFWAMSRNTTISQGEALSWEKLLGDHIFRGKECKGNSVAEHTFTFQAVDKQELKEKSYIEMFECYEKCSEEQTCLAASIAAEATSQAETYTGNCTLIYTNVSMTQVDSTTKLAVCVKRVNSAEMSHCLYSIGTNDIGSKVSFGYDYKKQGVPESAEKPVPVGTSNIISFSPNCVQSRPTDSEMTSLNTSFALFSCDTCSDRRFRNGLQLSIAVSLGICRILKEEDVSFEINNDTKIVRTQEFGEFTFEPGRENFLMASDDIFDITTEYSEEDEVNVTVSSIGEYLSSIEPCATEYGWFLNYLSFCADVAAVIHAV